MKYGKYRRVSIIEWRRWFGLFPLPYLYKYPVIKVESQKGEREISVKMIKNMGQLHLNELIIFEDPNNKYRVAVYDTAFFTYKKIIGKTLI